MAEFGGKSAAHTMESENASLQVVLPPLHVHMCTHTLMHTHVNKEKKKKQSLTRQRKWMDKAICDMWV